MEVEMKKLLALIFVFFFGSVLIGNASAAPIYPPPETIGLVFMEETNPELVGSLVVSFTFGERTIISQHKFYSNESIDRFCLATNHYFDWGILKAKDDFKWVNTCKNGLGEKGWTLISNE